MTRTRRSAALRLALLVSFLSAAGHAADAPAGDAFYVPPDPLPGGDGGTVVWSRPSTFAGGAIADSVDAHQVLYLSTTALGQRNAVSGTVLVPRAPYASGPRPIVGYGVGTQGMGDSCAASRGLVTGGTYEASFVQSALDRGWAVAVSDYEGLGTPGDHTYVVNLALGHAVIDSVRAAIGLEAAGLGKDSPVVFFGYSEGGAAVAAAGELAPEYAPELRVVAVASGAAPSDLPPVAAYQDGQLGFGSVFIAGLGYQAAYPELKLTENLNELGRAEADWARGACILDIIARFSGRRIADYTLKEPMSDPAFAARLEENRLGKRNPRVPVYLYHGETDQVIPLAVGESLRDGYCAQGAPVRWVTYPDAEHVLGQASGFEAAEEWLAQRLAGEPTTSDCPPGSGPNADGGTSVGAGSSGDDGGCSVAGPSSASRGGAGFAIAAGLVFAARRRRLSARASLLAAPRRPS